MYVPHCLAAPDFDYSSWLKVKETLGMPFPNVSEESLQALNFVHIIVSEICILPGQEYS